jgi:hypothetical protein
MLRIHAPVVTEYERTPTRLPCKSSGASGPRAAL